MHARGNLAGTLLRRPVSGLDQGEEPEASRDEPGGGFIRVNLRPPLQTSPRGKAMRVLVATLTLLVSSAAPEARFGYDHSRK